MKNLHIRQTLRFMRWVVLTYLLVLGGLMAHDTLWQGRVLNEGRAQLDALKLKDLSDPALAKTARDFDYVYRSAYFQTYDRRSYGFLLLGGGFLFLCALTCLERFLFGPVLAVPKPGSATPEKERGTVLVFAGCALVVLCATLLVLRWPQSTHPAVSTTHRAGPDAEVGTNSGAETRPAPVVEAVSLAAALEEETGHWPQFRGSVLPNRNPLPAHWNLSEKWRTTIPLKGFNSPVVWGDRVFLGGGDKNERAIFCYDATSGEQLWKAACDPVTEIPDVSDNTGFSAPTLCVDSKRVYAIFATGETLCRTHEGDPVWQRNLPHPEILYGYASSPLLLGDKLIVQYDLEETQTLYALSIHTGATVWEAKRKAAPSWSSPVALLADGKAMIFAAGNKTAEVFDAETGKVLWTHEGMGGEVATGAFAVASNHSFYFSNASAFTGAFSAMDGTILCQNPDVPAPDVASSVVLGGKHLLFTSGGSVIALDATDAKELYEEVFENGFYASPVIVQGKIVAVNLDGDLFLMDASGDQLKIEAKYSLGTEISATPAFHRGCIILRTAANDLICLEAKPQ